MIILLEFLFFLRISNIEVRKTMKTKIATLFAIYCSFYIKAVSGAFTTLKQNNTSIFDIYKDPKKNHIQLYYTEGSNIPCSLPISFKHTVIKCYPDEYLKENGIINIILLELDAYFDDDDILIEKYCTDITNDLQNGILPKCIEDIRSSILSIADEETLKNAAIEAGNRYSDFFNPDYDNDTQQT